MTDHAELLDRLYAIAAAAGSRILAIRSRPHGTISKGDGSPLTEADLAAEEVISVGLAQAAPGLPVVSEEAATRPDLARGRSFLLVDPLDGTREFLGQSGEFTVNIALVEEGRPVCGVVLAPALGRVWRGLVGRGADAACLPASGGPRWRPIRVRPYPRVGLTAVASRSHPDPETETEAFLASLPVATRRSIGSSLKFCLVAEGEADVYPRFGPTMEWDTAAGHAVLEAAGGHVRQRGGPALAYGKAKEGYRNGPFVAAGPGPMPGRSEY